MAGGNRITRRELRTLHRRVWGARTFAIYRRTRRRIVARRRGGFALTGLGFVILAIGIGASAGAAPSASPATSPWVQQPTANPCLGNHTSDALLHDACAPDVVNAATDPTSLSSSSTEPPSTTTTPTTSATTTSTRPTTTTSIILIPPITLTSVPATTSSTTDTTMPGPVSTQGSTSVSVTVAHAVVTTTQLPHTGSDTTPLLILGSATIAAGLVLQRRNPREMV